jgi:hypothetical protein
MSDEDTEALDEEFIKAGSENLCSEGDSEVEVFLPIEEQSTPFERLQSAITNSSTLIRKKGDYAHPLNTKEYWPLSFVLLYPFGKGYNQKFGNTLEYTRHTLERGSGRQFQKNAGYIFTRYHHETRRRIGGICSLMAARSIKQSSDDALVNDDICAEDMRTLVDMQREKTTENMMFNGDKDKVEGVLKRMTPYGNSIPGTQPHIKQAKNQVLAMINSPVILEQGDFTWFSTVAFADAFDPLLYCIAVDEVSDKVKSCLGPEHDIEVEYEERSAAAEVLDIKKRKELLRDHPALACRLFDLKQNAILKVVLMGKHEPLGT